MVSYIILSCDITRCAGPTTAGTLYTSENSKHVYLYIPGARDDAFNWTRWTRLLRTLPPAAAVYLLLARERTVSDGRTDTAAQERTHALRLSHRYIIVPNMCPKQNPYTASRPSDATRDIILYYYVYTRAATPPFYRSDYSPSRHYTYYYYYNINI